MVFTGEGQGTELDPYRIEYLEHVYQIRDDLSGYYVFMRDLDFNNDEHYLDLENKTTWTTDGGWWGATNFAGVLDGRGYTLSSLFSNWASPGNFSFMRTVTQDGVIKNLGLLNINFNHLNNNNASGFVATNRGLIENCYAIGTLITSMNGGGFIDQNFSTINNCYASVSGTSTSANEWHGVGGFCAYYDEDDINNCFWNKDVGGEHAQYPLPEIPSMIGDQGTIIGKTEAELKQLSTYQNAGWSVSSISTNDTEIWGVDEGVDFARLYFEFKELEYPLPELQIDLIKKKLGSRDGYIYAKSILLDYGLILKNTTLNKLEVIELNMPNASIKGIDEVNETKKLKLSVNGKIYHLELQQN